MLHLNSINEITYYLLQSLFSKDYLKDFALAGGTSLALQLGHRKSIDIDLFSFDDAEQNAAPDLLLPFPEWRKIKTFITKTVNDYKI